MSTKPRRYCLAWPCQTLAVPGSSYCPDHQQPEAPKATDPFYLSVRWRRFREWYIANHPLCVRCQADGYIVRATIVDHVVELKDGGAPYDESNTQSLCLSCHNTKTALERNRRNPLKSNRVGSRNLS